MKNREYIVQMRRTATGHLINLGRFYAKSGTNAIRQAAEILARNGEDVIELVATQQEPQA